ncbi:MAG TPA: dethiobiotin synthase [Candidatus Binatia bacterium]|nr:dethiobiotin synthase [Candidatus Binatia bacterium]
MTRTIFVTGTDTGVGKTLVACALLRRLRADGRRVCGFKPVATGCVRTADGLRNDDALALLAASGSDADYADVNPYAFEPPIAPHLAAQAAGRRISIPALDAAHARLARDHDVIVVEGAGGWAVPLDEAWTLGEWAAEREWPVVLVVGMRLGCINHALLSAQAIARRTRLAGWVANALPPTMAALEENVEALTARLTAPLLAVIGSPDSAVAALDLAPLKDLLKPVPTGTPALR